MGGYTGPAVSVSKKEYRYVKMYKNHFVKFLRYACLFDCLDKGRRIGTRSGRAGPPFSVRPEKEAKGAVLHGTSAAGRRSHEPTRSANLPKLNASRRFKHMERFVFAPAVRDRDKNPLTSHAIRFCGRCLGLQEAA